MREIWDHVLAGAGYIFSETIGGLLGWVSALTVLAVPFLVICFVLKKFGYGRFIRIGFREAPPGFGLDSLDPWRKVDPVEPALPDDPKEAERPRNDVPQWQKEMMETWDKEAKSRGTR
jgi:hypothetical protein